MRGVAFKIADKALVLFLAGFSCVRGGTHEMGVNLTLNRFQQEAEPAPIYLKHRSTLGTEKHLVRIWRRSASRLTAAHPVIERSCGRTRNTRRCNQSLIHALAQRERRTLTLAGTLKLCTQKPMLLGGVRHPARPA